eukprot:Pgem_evm1s1605
MINVKKKTCDVKGCKKKPCFNFEGETPLFCKDHIQKGMIDVYHKKCGDDNCTKRPNFYGYCLTCYISRNQVSEIAKAFKNKTKEMIYVQAIIDEILDYLEEKEIDYECLITDQKVKGGCSKRRPDIGIDLYTHVIIIEIDEDQHKTYDYSCEQNRVIQLSEDFNNRKIIFIRVNPDKYQDENGTKHPGCFTIDDDVLIHFLFYDGFDCNQSSKFVQKYN